MTEEDVLKELEQLLVNGASAHVVFGAVAAFVETQVHRDLVEELKQQSQSLDHYAARIEKLEKKLRLAAGVSHSGGFAGMSEADVLVQVRKITRPYWDRTAKPDDVRAALEKSND